MDCNSRRQICLDFKSDIVILLESVYKGFGLSRSLHVLTIITGFLILLHLVLRIWCLLTRIGQRLVGACL
jgi:hypothetical protein